METLLMGYSIKDYFEANRLLAQQIQSMEQLKAKPSNVQLVRDAEKRLEAAANCVDELIEIFTWETTNTDKIRLAFIHIAVEVEDQLLLIKQCGLHPSPFNGTDNRFRLVEELIDSFRIALCTTGECQPIVRLTTRAQEWKSEGLMAYVRDMQRHLNNTTFDNLLEALVYFEKSSAMLHIFFKLLDERGHLK
ncbi:hypothetical protein J7E50_02775 [Pedobacter sp. ISL-68]|uniref:hypothetical protein n=1 Tax=unclassified Pedobacter TaxID=2628915 RepID=UPI001BE9B486|nr:MULTISPECIES: hypothetical protein [unclassified Pedobacter]MBT2560144.1 hypothetical protein [Pedobacter sp. ISL-64]MBT2589123.1 hypothetical protein [Pedobacter sp. ISL-68]